MMQALQEEMELKEEFITLQQYDGTESERILKYEEMQILLTLFNEMNQEIVPLEESNLSEKYTNGDEIARKDWFAIYEELYQRSSDKTKVRKHEIVILGAGDMVEGQLQKKLEKNQILTQQGEIYRAEDSEIENYIAQKVEVYTHEAEIIAVIRQIESQLFLPNVWIAETDEQNIRCYLAGYHIRYMVQEKQQAEQVADLTFEQGVLKHIVPKTKRINEKVLQIGEKTITLQDTGEYPIADDFRCYKLFGAFEICEKQDIPLGYSYTDFVLDNGEICAALITKSDDMETIRVLIRNDGFADIYHEMLTICAEDDCRIVYGAYGEQKEEILEAGKILQLEQDSEWLLEGRIQISPLLGTGKLTVTSLTRNQGNPTYRGSLEIEKREQGLLLVNELLLEEYLYSVVPSEMPASYPAEALMAQAVCARTYAYRYIQHAGLGDFGAHVDDSVNYQVYNNIAENHHTTEAVKETYGQLLLYEGKPAGTYYYSTSCGFGTNADIWKGNTGEDTSYLQGSHIGTEQVDADLMIDDQYFEQYITRVHESDYEKEEKWYRWSYTVEEINLEKICEKMQDCYERNENLILTQKKSEEFVSSPIKKLSDIIDIRCGKRGQGGVMEEMLIETTSETYKIITEYNIRYILGTKEATLVRADKEQITAGELLPSAFMIIKADREDGIVVSYTINGGGYGHGVGMSQNGAKAMGTAGFSYKEILQFYYKNCEVSSTS